MKPLELIVPQSERGCHCCLPRYIMPDGGKAPGYQAERMAKVKRLTDAELAAEYWKAACIDECFMSAEDTQGPEYDRAFSQTMTLKRFATLPHYDEVTE